MITTLIGRSFLKAFNEKYNKELSAKDFFEQKYFELFFNHSKYMQWATNSPFVQGITTSDNNQYGVELLKVSIKDENLFNTELNNHFLKYGKERITVKTERSKGVIKILLLNDSIQRTERLETFNKNIEGGASDGSIAIGYPASEEKEFGKYSGQVSDIDLVPSNDDVYLSWLGGGLGVGVAGGYNLLINDEHILLSIYEGWKVYRKLLNDPILGNKLLPNKINTWNGQWLTFLLGKDFQSDFDYFTLNSLNVFKNEENMIGINTINWTYLFFSLSRLYPLKTLNTYIYSLGEKNKTIGFIPLNLKSGTRLKDMFRQLYGSSERFDSKEFQSLYGMHIKRACELGSIGLQALRPEGLKKFMSDGKNFTFKKEEETIIYQSYKTWLIAMLSKNKQEIKDYTIELAELILRYRKGASGTERKNLIEKGLFDAKSKRQFIDSLTEMIKGLEDKDLIQLKTLKDEVHLMTNEEFGYFNTLLKFDYAFVEKQS